MFGGAHELSIDSKGRLAVPAKFRDILSRLYTPAVVATLESKHKLLMYPVAEWEKVAAQLLNLKWRITLFCGGFKIFCCITRKFWNGTAPAGCWFLPD